ncbi:MAG: sigma-70 family RNA polymerase sigma factor, partial [Clostridia bacterium]|nr:sigma-70 family RNA polymerase sigma factor [Clostridia bacterium]
KFDISFDVEFSTYAVPMIIGEIRRFLRDDGIIKVSRSLKETALRAKQAGEKIAKEKGSDATLGEIAEALGCEPSEIALALEATMPPESIYKSVSDDSNTPVLLIDKLCRESSGEEKIINSVSLKEEIKKLPVRDRQILMLRFFKEKTQSEVARILGLSQVQISRIEKKVLSALREKIG